MAELCDTQPLFPGHNEVDQLEQILACLGALPDTLKVQVNANPAFKNLLIPSAGKDLESLNRYKGKLSERGVDLLRKMLVLDPGQRISAGEALKHPYFDIVRPRRQRFQKTS